MSKLTDFVNKGVRLIVADDSEEAVDAAPTGEPSSPPPPPSRRRTREIEAEALDVEPPTPVVRSQVAADVADFGAVYQEAGIELPLHGYGIDKVSDMLDNKRLAAMTPEVRAAAVMAALEAASVPLRDVIQDAVRRDKALDAFEDAKAAEVGELKSKSAARMQALREEVDAFVKAKNAEIEALKTAADAAGEAFAKLRDKKRKEEERLFGVVAQFAEGGENPITKSS
jgi:hypothetical protein